MSHARPLSLSSAIPADRASNPSSASQGTPVVFVVDDDIAVRQSLESLIGSAGWQSQMFASAMEFLVSPRPLSPSCLVLDVLLPGLSGLDLQELITDDRSDMPIIFITGHGTVPMTVRAMKGGALEFLTKPFRDDVLLDAIGEALKRSRAVLDAQAKMRALRDRYGSLSCREREVMASVVAGRLNKQIAGYLGISEITVKAHRGKMMRKMNAHSLPDLVNMAVGLELDLHAEADAMGHGPGSDPHRRTVAIRAGHASRIYPTSQPFSPGRQANQLPFSALR